MRSRTLAPIFGFILAASAFGQADPYHQLFFETKVGSFKMLGFDETHPSTGKLTMSFTGTILLSGYEGAAPIITGHVRKDYENKDRKKLSYFGTGSVTIDGRWTSFQWFGRDLKAEFNGSAVVRLYGEYDRDGQTGFARYGSQKEAAPWYQGGREFQVPLPQSMHEVVPKERGK